MGRKHKHAQDKLFKTVSELKSHHVGPDRELELSVQHRRLKFNYCCLTLNAVVDKPMGLTDDDGWCYVFECDQILRFLQKFQLHPITGSKVSASQLIELKFHKNKDGEFHCPILFKLFNQNSRIVANRKTGNVYSYDACQQLNLKPKFFRDLLTDEPFDEGDLVTIQNPDKASTKWAVTEFHYVKNKLRLDDDSEASKIRNIEQQSDALKSSLSEFERRRGSIDETFNKIFGDETQTPSTARDSSAKLDKINSANHSDGALARSVTSTVEPKFVEQRAALLNEEQILYPRIKKKGYAQLVTNMGLINLELYCDRTPKTCHNFLLLAERNYYDGTIFHRLIKNFILQGGDPTGTGKGGESAWGAPFKDECHGDLRHTGRGVVAMANSGPNSNKSQFYIILKGAWDHLDGKHTVFGRVVGGEATLDRIEAVEVDKEDRPKREIKISRVVVYVNPFGEATDSLEEERRRLAQEGERAKASKETGAKRLLASDEGSAGPQKRFRSGVGAFVDVESVQRAASSAKTTPASRLASSSREPPTITNDDNRDSSRDNRTAGTLSSKLASLGAKRLKRDAAAYGEFSNW